VTIFVSLKLSIFERSFDFKAVFIANKLISTKVVISVQFRSAALHTP